MNHDLWNAQWTKLAPLAKGGQGFTYTVRKSDSSDAPICVLKVLKAQKDPERRARMRREVAILEHLRHSNIAQVIESNASRDGEEHELYIIMEYVEGSHLRDFIAGGLPEIRAAAAIVDSLLSTLAHCHRKETIHRDIKPENIILRNGDPKDVVLLDFGLSFNQEVQASSFESDPNQHLGNRFIVLPEYGVGGSDKRNAASDITQCVGILFFLTTGEDPGNIMDEQSQPPHRRLAAMNKLRSYPTPIADQLNRIFETGFQQPFLRRWQSIETLRLEIAKLHSPQTKKPTFKERLAATKDTVLNTPDNLVSDQIHKLVNISGQVYMRVWSELQETLGGIVRGVGSAVEPGQSLWRIGSGLVSKYKPQLQINFCFFLVREKDEIKLLGIVTLATLPVRVVVAMGPTTQGVQEIARFGIFDPQVEVVLQEAFEDFLADHVLPVIARQQ
jgi:serine/threonine-protein kinase